MRVVDIRQRREEYYIGIIRDPELQVKLSGSWETLIGEQDTFCERTYPYFCTVYRWAQLYSVVHILEYENYRGLDKAAQLINASEVSKSASAVSTGIMTSLSRLAASNQIQANATIFDFTHVTAESRICIHAYRSAARPWRRFRTQDIPGTASLNSLLVTRNTGF